MDPSLLTSQRGRHPGASVTDAEPSSTPIDESPSLESATTNKNTEGQPPPRKKPKLAPPRPLRIVRPPGSNTAATSSRNASIIAPLVASESKLVEPSPSGLATTPKSNGSNSSNSAPGSSQNQVSYVSSDCNYCHKLIEGGEAGRRRHQNGQRHVFNVLRGVDKYMAPFILPFAQWRYPTSLSSISAATGSATSFLEEQGRLIADFVERPSDASIEELKASYRSIDVNLAFFLLITQPRGMKAAAKSLTWETLDHLRNLHGHLPFPSTLPKCPICAAEEEYSVHSRHVAPALPELESDETLNAPTASPSHVNQYLTDSIGKTLTESLFLEYLRHLASDEHRKAIDKFWRDHHVSHPNSPAMSKLTVPQVKHGKSLLKDAVNPPDEPRNAYLFKLKESHFVKDSYALDMAHLQRSIEAWAKLRNLINTATSVQPRDESASNIDALSSPYAPHPNLVPLPGFPFAFPHPFNPLVPFAGHPWGLHPLPSNTTPAIPVPQNDADVPLKQRILKFALPYDTKKGERIGARWADAVKAFIAANPGMSTTQIIKLSRLERAGDPRRQPTWYPSFGGVWNESTRADHQRSFFRSSSQKDHKRH